MTLGVQQQEALDLMLKFIDSDDICFSLTGYAGTGKTFLMKAFIEELKKLNKHHIICAPTHKAKTVLERFTGLEGMTIHKLLSLSPNLNILLLDYKDLKFNIPAYSASFPYKSIIIVDESSMVNNQLFDLLIERAEENECKVVFVGDPGQIMPVNSDNISKVFNVESTYKLTDIFRQHSQSILYKILYVMRTKSVNGFRTMLSKHGSIFKAEDLKDLKDQSLEHFKKAVEKEDVHKIKILSYLNANVEAFNLNIHKTIFGEEEYYKGEFLTCYENVKHNKKEFWNSMDYIIQSDPIEINIKIPYIGEYKGYSLDLLDTSNNSILNVKLLSKKYNNLEDFEYIAYRIEQIRLDAIQAKSYGRNANQFWRKYYTIMESFTTPIPLIVNGRVIKPKTFDYGYAITIHKAQGSTYEHVSIDMSSLKYCQNPVERRQLQYVAFSRAVESVIVLEDKSEPKFI